MLDFNRIARWELTVGEVCYLKATLITNYFPRTYCECCSNSQVARLVICSVSTARPSGCRTGAGVGFRDWSYGPFNCDLGSVTVGVTGVFLILSYFRF